MGKDWDHHKGGRKEWVAWMESVMRECLRVMKPGAHGLVWALPRTSHWTATALEDAGFEIRDCIYHIFGSGFPKSLDVSKAIDKAAGAEREVIGERDVGPDMRGDNFGRNEGQRMLASITAPATEDAKRWAGWGTALKPAVECWWLVRKPLAEKTVAANVLKWGTGALNIDGCRIGTAADMNPRDFDDSKRSSPKFSGILNGGKEGEYLSRTGTVPNGRFPAHVVFDEEAAAMLDAQSGKRSCGHVPRTGKTVSMFGPNNHAGGESNNGYGDSGGASRFFYCAKTSSSERGEDNKHPTVKPQKLMRYLCKLITPPNGVVLDPFMGSGSTGLAAKSEGFGFIGIEREPEYYEISKARVEQTAQGGLI